MCMHTGAHKCQKRVSNPLGLELEVVVSHYVGARNQTSPWKSKLTLNL